MNMTPKQSALLVAEMETFLRVPKVGYAEWMDLDSETKAALLVAARRIEIDRALMLADAFSGPEARLRLYAKVDGGEAWLDWEVGRALDDYFQTRIQSRLPLEGALP